MSKLVIFIVPIVDIERKQYKVFRRSDHTSPFLYCTVIILLASMLLPLELLRRIIFIIVINEIISNLMLNLILNTFIKPSK